MLTAVLTIGFLALLLPWGSALDQLARRHLAYGCHLLEKGQRPHDP